MSKMKYTIEVTDTFGGEANYCFCNRQELIVDDDVSDLAIVRRAKKMAGWSGLRCRVDNHGYMIALYPYGYNLVMFIVQDEVC